MQLKLIEYNVQDFFIRLGFQVAPADLAGLTEAEWQLLGSGDVPNKPLAKLFAIARIFAEEAPDIAMLCEVGSMESLANFARLFLADTYVPYILPGNSNRGIESGFLVRVGLPLTAEIRTHKDWPVPFQYLHEQDPTGHDVTAMMASVLDLGKPEERKLSRDIPELRLTAPGAKAPALVILLAHLKSAFNPDRIDPRGSVRRFAEAQALKAILAATEQELGPSVPIIIAGDLNASAARAAPDQELRWLYEHTQFEDVLEIAGCESYERITHMTFFQDQVHARQLDYILLPAVLQSKLDKTKTYVYRYRFDDDEAEMELPFSLRERWLLPSDHYPVVCVIDLDLPLTAP